VRDGLARLLKHADLAAAGLVVVVVVMMIVPLPTALLDILITLNITTALAVLVATTYMPRPLDFASFPSLLLLATLFRLAINVSVTRLILLHGDAGSVIHSFGNFVIGGNLVIGLVVFLILVVIQFVVITNGAGRVAEVAARFTLDAMPGKQMAIDADLNAGQITDDEAKKRRQEIQREADFYGAMDGASKFVKGDAIAGVIIVAVNLIGGMAVGVLQHHLSFTDAVHTFSVLTIGDGLAAQIPALLISTATGIIVTRSAAEANLGSELTMQLFRQPKAPLVAGVVVALMALLPGLPKLPFLIVGAAMIALGQGVKRDQAARLLAKKQEQDEANLPAVPTPPDAAIGDLAIDPLELVIGFGLVPLVDQRAGGALLTRVGVVRRQIAAELGIVIPAVRIHDDSILDSHEYAVRVRGTTVASGKIVPGHRLAINPGDGSSPLVGIPTVEPAFNLPAVWIDESMRGEAEALGYTVVDGESVIVTHLTETIRRHVHELLTRQETKKLLDALKEQNAAAVEDVVPDRLGVGEVQRVLQQLLREGISIRDLGVILETIGDRAAMTRDPSILAEYARQSLARTITSRYLAEDNTLRVISLDPNLEEAVAESLTQTPDGEQMALDPSRAQTLVHALSGQVDRATAMGARPVLICSSRVRRHLRRLIEQAFPQLPVVAYNEIAANVRVETTGVVTA
jgi:flagellar biosynthesis protein FlhA